MEIQSYGLDWLTLTNVVRNDDRPPPLLVHFACAAEVTTKWAGNGYKGRWDEEHGIRYGSRHRKDGSSDEILTMSGEQTSHLVDKIENVLDYRVTRMDLETTVELEEREANLAGKWYDAIMARKRLGTSVTGKRKVSLVQSDTGQTLYVGARKSGLHFFRFYDKSLPLGAELGQIWRQEVQYGSLLAEEAFKWYVPRREEGAAIINLVSAEFSSHVGFTLLSPTKTGPEVNFKPLRKKTTLQKKLDWLSTCVKPTIALLLEHEMENELMAALGLGKDGWEESMER